MRKRLRTATRTHTQTKCEHTLEETSDRSECTNEPVKDILCVGGLGYNENCFKIIGLSYRGLLPKMTGHKKVEEGETTNHTYQSIFCCRSFTSRCNFAISESYAAPFWMAKLSKLSRKAVTSLDKSKYPWDSCCVSDFNPRSPSLA